MNQLSTHNDRGDGDDMVFRRKRQNVWTPFILTFYRDDDLSPSPSDFRFQISALVLFIVYIIAIALVVQRPDSKPVQPFLIQPCHSCLFQQKLLDFVVLRPTGFLFLLLLAASCREKLTSRQTLTWWQKARLIFWFHYYKWIMVLDGILEFWWQGGIKNGWTRHDIKFCQNICVQMKLNDPILSKNKHLGTTQVLNELGENLKEKYCLDNTWKVLPKHLTTLWPQLRH